MRRLALSIPERFKMRSARLCAEIYPLSRRLCTNHVSEVSEVMSKYGATDRWFDRFVGVGEDHNKLSVHQKKLRKETEVSVLLLQKSVIIYTDASLGMIDKVASIAGISAYLMFDDGRDIGIFCVPSKHLKIKEAEMDSVLQALELVEKECIEFPILIMNDSLDNVVSLNNNMNMLEALLLGESEGIEAPIWIMNDRRDNVELLNDDDDPGAGRTLKALEMTWKIREKIEHRLSATMISWIESKDNPIADNGAKYAREHSIQSSMIN